ncbi:MAG: hypothetical protein SGCHY_000999 [Lobulomycetales sp.]
MLVAAGYTPIKETCSFASTLVPGGKYFYTRNSSALIAFSIGSAYKSGNPFAIIGTHSDSPCLKVRPVSKKEKCGFLQVGVELYGGGLWHTWFDRDLGLAGRVMVEQPDGKLVQSLVRVSRPILRIPTLAIHLTKDRDSFTFNRETHLTPVLGQVVADELNKPAQEPDTAWPTGYMENHHSVLLDIVAKELGVAVESIRDFELCLYDTQAPCLGGAQNEFVHSARLDNLGMSFCALEALINSKGLDTEESIRMVAIFDNEEIGSTSAPGADGNLLDAAVRRISSVPMGGASATASFDTAMLRSMLISADMAHAIHPNYMEKHEELHRPKMNGGVVIKQNANQRYATNSVTSLVLKEAAKVCGQVLQEFVVRNDSPCGSTIGPMLSAKLGMRTIDVGNPQWSMHSIRETCGSQDVEKAIVLFTAWFENYSKISARIVVD